MKAKEQEKIKNIKEDMKQQLKEQRAEAREKQLGANHTAASEMLVEKGITITELEMRMLIEAALAEFNKAFEKQKKVILLLHFYCVTVRI